MLIILIIFSKKKNYYVNNVISFIVATYFASEMKSKKRLPLVVNRWNLNPEQYLLHISHKIYIYIFFFFSLSLFNFFSHLFYTIIDIENFFFQVSILHYCLLLPNYQNSTPNPPSRAQTSKPKENSQALIIRGSTTSPTMGHLNIENYYVIMDSLYI